MKFGRVQEEATRKNSMERKDTKGIREFMKPLN